LEGTALRRSILSIVSEARASSRQPQQHGDRYTEAENMSTSGHAQQLLEPFDFELNDDG
jgi:hypothetical protein